MNIGDRAEQRAWWKGMRKGMTGVNILRFKERDAGILRGGVDEACE